MVYPDSLSDKTLALQHSGFILNELVKDGICRNRLSASPSDKKSNGDLKKKNFHYTRVEIIKN